MSPTSENEEEGESAGEESGLEAAEPHADHDGETGAQSAALEPPSSPAGPASPILPDRRKEARRRRLTGWGIMSAGLLAAFLLMANDAQLPHGPLWGALCMLVATGGLLHLFGASTRGIGAIPWGQTWLGSFEGERAWLSPAYALPFALCLLAVGALLGGYEALPWVILLSLLPLLPAAIRRPGLLVVVVVAALYLPLLGTFGLWDPWETHYGEVAREMLARDDWISLWWAQENWFWSKPILIFWSEALAMGALGVNHLPDANPAHPEWALRLPIAIMAMGAISSVYLAIGRLFGRRAGVLSALVLATMPHFFLLAHQAITDMPFVANMTIAMCLLILGVTEDPEREAKSYAIGPFTLSGRHAVLGLLFLIVAPQALYLMSRNVTMVDFGQFAWGWDSFSFGSAGNHGVPGNAPAHTVQPHFTLMQPAVQGCLWACGLAFLLWRAGREKFLQPLFMLAFYVFCGLAFMGKGIPGFALPGLVAFLYLLGSKRWSLLLEGRLRVAVGAVVVGVVGLPWYVAMYVRHGPPFTDRILIHDHINRLASGVHGDTGSLEYFLEQLGTGMFPWVALVPAALTLWLWNVRDDGGSSDGGANRRQAMILVAIWFAGAFTLFSAMITKFHHYIFPVIPPAAILVGLLLDRLWGRSRSTKTTILSTSLAILAPVPLVLGVAGLWGDVRGLLPEGASSDWALDNGLGPLVSASLLLVGVLLLAAALHFMRGAKGVESDKAFDIDPVSAGVLLAGGAVLVAFVGRDLSWVTDARPQGYERLIQLFVYNYGRPWPEELDYRPILTGFAVVAGVVVALCTVRALRPAALPALLGVALAFTAWTLDVYIIDLSPHWGQRELVKRYYDERANEDEPIVAWQMNWKGENFYTGNHVSVFVDLDNKKIREWIGENRGTRTFFMLEHGRLSSLRGILPGREIREVTTKRDCNKFILVETVL